jgi:hypothetical protein
MTLIIVNSSAIHAVGYDGNTLAVQFYSSDKVYSHPGVPYSVFTEFMNASSMGEYYTHHIRGRYR